MDKRISASVWGALVLVAALDVTGCGESTTNGDGGNGGDAGDGEGGTVDRGGASATGGSTSGRGGMAGRGGSPTGGSAGDAGAGATSGDAGEAGEGGTAGTGGVGGDAGSGGDPGGGGDAGDGPVDTAVHGRVVDFWLAPVPNVPVTIGTTQVLTDAEGRFSVDAVPSVYDVKLIVSVLGSQAGDYAWCFEGLSRRDPTLQVQRGRSNRQVNIQFATQNANVDATRMLALTIGTPSGSNHFFASNGSGVRSVASWVGPQSTMGTAHGLLWSIDSNELPTAYHAYSSSSATLVDGASEVLFTLAMADSTMASNTVSGSITSNGGSDRVNWLFARHPDGSATKIVEDYPPPDTYSYLAPTIAMTSITVAASTGYSTTAYAIGHRDGLTAGQSAVALTIPTSVVAVVPTSGLTGVNASTQFSWTGTSSVSVFHVEDTGIYRGLFVVTTRRQITLPAFNGFALRGNQAHTWRVETHGSVASVDQFTGPQGGLDSFSWRLDSPEGPKTSDGSYAHSFPRGFSTAP